jgi:hypothetical protein
MILFVVGWVPLLVYGVWDWLAGDPNNPSNPLGCGCWGTFVGGSGFLLMLIALSQDPPSKPDGGA